MAVKKAKIVTDPFSTSEEGQENDFSFAIADDWDSAKNARFFAGPFPSIESALDFFPKEGSFLCKTFENGKVDILGKVVLEDPFGRKVKLEKIGGIRISGENFESREFVQNTGEIRNRLISEILSPISAMRRIISSDKNILSAEDYSKKFSDWTEFRIFLEKEVAPWIGEFDKPWEELSERAKNDCEAISTAILRDIHDQLQLLDESGYKKFSKEDFISIMDILKQKESIEKDLETEDRRITPINKMTRFLSCLRSLQEIREVSPNCTKEFHEEFVKFYDSVIEGVTASTLKKMLFSQEVDDPLKTAMSLQEKKVADSLYCLADSRARKVLENVVFPYIKNANQEKVKKLSETPNGRDHMIGYICDVWTKKNNFPFQEVLQLIDDEATQDFNSGSYGGYRACKEQRPIQCETYENLLLLESMLERKFLPDFLQKNEQSLSLSDQKSAEMQI